MTKVNGVNYSMTVQAKLRRQSAITLLEKQLESGKKPRKVYDEKKKCWKTQNRSVKLTESEIEKKQKELATLKARI